MCRTTNQSSRRCLAETPEGRLKFNNPDDGTPIKEMLSLSDIPPNYPRSPPVPTRAGSP